MKRVVFICTGNTCRSPMAKGLMAMNLEKSYPELEGKIEILTAGLMAFPGDSASPKTIVVMDEIGIDLSDHRARSVTPQLLDEADYVFTMTRGHREQLRQIFGREEKIHTLYSYLGENGDVQDPFGRGERHYRECRDEIEGLIRRILPIIYLEIINKNEDTAWRNPKDNVENR